MTGYGTTAGGERCAFEFDDGAYILGALSPTERAEFERHLAQCPACRQSLADLAVLPGLLGRLHSFPAGSVRPTALGESARAPETLLPRMLTAAAQVRRTERRAQRLRRLRVAVAAAVAGVAAATAVGVGVHLYDRQRATPTLFVAPDPTSSPDQSYSSMWSSPGATPLAAEVALRPVDGGTLVSVRCHEPGGSGGSWPLWLVIYARDDDEAEPIGSWVSAPGKDLAMTGLTHYTPDQIDRIEVQDYHQSTVLWWQP